MAPPPTVNRKRPAAVKIEPGKNPLRGGPLPKKIKSDPGIAPMGTAGAAIGPSNEELEEKFLAMFEEPAHAIHGVSNSVLKTRFGQSDYERLAPIINSFLATSRLSMSRGSAGAGKTAELFYTLVSSEVASKFSGLDVSARLVYQVIERSGNMGIWTKDIKKETNIQNLALNKIFKTLESRRLIKPVKSISAKAKKLYMLYELQPSTELTGGIWYSDLEFDFGFINELRNFLIQCVRKLNQGRGVTLQEVLKKLNQAQISKVNLGVTEVGQIMQTLVYDHAVEAVQQPQHAASESLATTTTTTLDSVAGGADAVGGSGHDEESPMYYVASRRITTMCEFKMWNDVLAPDFHFRTIAFEDGVTLKPHEPHYHS